MTHKTHFEVRDYECDLQGIVNHAVYLNYMEHSRHQFLKDSGGDFEALHREGLDLVVVHANVSYHASLRSGDGFVVALTVEMSGKVRLLFHQKIIRLSDEKPMVTAIMTVAAVRGGRSVRVDGILPLPV